jgi:hypothetical protein
MRSHPPLPPPSPPLPAPLSCVADGGSDAPTAGAGADAAAGLHEGEAEGGLHVPAGAASTAPPQDSLPWRPRHLFTLGSPIGLFYSLRGYTRATLGSFLARLAAFPPTGEEWCGTRLHNVFDDHDPVAYRLTPLLWPPSTPAPAQRVLAAGETARPPASVLSAEGGEEGEARRLAALYAGGLDVMVPRRSAGAAHGAASALMGTAFEVVQVSQAGVGGGGGG